MTGAYCGATGSGTSIDPYYLKWLFGVYSLWRETLFTLYSVGRALVLLQSNVLDLVDSLWEALPSLRRWVEGMWGEQGEGMEWKLGLVCNESIMQWFDPKK